MEIISENDKKRIFLSGYRSLVTQEELALQRIQELRINKICPTVVNDGMPHGNTTADLSGYAVLINELTEALKNIRERADTSRRNILKSIKKMENKDEQILLRLKYIQGLSMTESADMLGVSKRKSYDILNSAVENFEI